MTSFLTSHDGPDRRRVVILDASPEVDGGRYPAKGIVGDPVRVSCDLLVDGHDAIAGAVLYRFARQGSPDPSGAGSSGEPVEPPWTRVALVAGVNDRWSAAFVPTAVGVWELGIEAWVDPYATLIRGMKKKLDAGEDVSNELELGRRLLEGAASRVPSGELRVLESARITSSAASTPAAVRVAALMAEDVVATLLRHPDLRHATRYDPRLKLRVDPKLARFSAWYELFPRSTVRAGESGESQASGDSGDRLAHGTLKDTIARLPYVAALGFDVLYLPPIHPIGRSFRKGPNNTLTATASDVGSPWAIGAREGGHKAVHPQLGTVLDLVTLVREARRHGLEVALDIAFQASPDHPYVTEHPEWFVHRADGSIQYAENPPKKYEDVYPFDFECDDWRALFHELLSVFLFWGEQGVRVFRVDNPHTKSLRFWEWCLEEVKAVYPDALFLAEAFTRPKLMYALAKAGFSQSYTYFTWRHTGPEFTAYLTEITRAPVSDYYRPNFWTNTPDILPEHLQFGGRATFIQRLLLAATLASSYGLYGPAFELMEHEARPGSEEYIDNEKYQLRQWDTGRDDSLKDIIALVNRIRREESALQHNALTFHATTNDQLLAFSKRAGAGQGQSVVLVVITLDPRHKHTGFIELDHAALGLSEREKGETFQVHDLLADTRFSWQGDRGYVEVDPEVMPGSIFKIRRKLRSEHDFEYFL